MSRPKIERFGRLRRLQRQRVESAAAEPGARLQFGEDQRWREQRVRDVRRDVDLQPVQSEQPAGEPAKQQMKSVERQTADEDADADRRGFAFSARALGPQTVEHPSDGGVHRVIVPASCSAASGGSWSLGV